MTTAAQRGESATEGHGEPTPVAEVADGRRAKAPRNPRGTRGFSALTAQWALDGEIAPSASGSLGDWFSCQLEAAITQAHR